MATLVTLIITSLANAAPVTNIPSTDSAPLISPSFVPEPKGRGTFRLLSSCVITLVICIWTAVHPNIIKNPTTRRRFINKAIYVVLGLFSPEIILAVAFKEWNASDEILREARLVGAAAYAEEEISLADKVNPDVGAGAQADKVEADKVEVEVKNQMSVETGERIDQKLDSLRDMTSKARTAAADARTAVADGRPAAANARTAAANARTAADASTAAGYFTAAAGDARTAAEDARTAAEDARREASAIAEKQKIALHAARRLRVARRAYETAIAPRKLSPFWRRIDTGIEIFHATWMGNLLRPAEASVYEFSRECAFFAVMGGYTICPLDIYTEPDHESTISPEGLKFLLQEQILTTDVLGKLKIEVLDKEKSNMLAKLLVCMQALWMLVNCLARKVSGLPITLLELNVSTHVICAVTVYVFWWMKPHDAGRPISLSPIFLKPGLCELIYTMNKFGPDFRASETDPIMLSPSPTVPEEDGAQKTTVENGGALPSELQNVDPKKTPELDLDIGPAHRSRDGDKLAPGLIDPNITPVVPNQLPTPTAAQELDITTVTERNETLPSKLPKDPFQPSRSYPIQGFALREESDERELKICAAAAQELRHTTYKQLVIEGEGPWALHTLKVQVLTEPSRFKTGKGIAWLLFPLCLIYAGIHASAWNSYFPTPMERRLWRASCIIIGAPGLGANAIWFGERMFSPGPTFKKTVGEFFGMFELEGIKKTMGFVALTLLAIGLSVGQVYAFRSLIRQPHTTERLYLLALCSVGAAIWVGAGAVSAVVAFGLVMASIDWEAVWIVISVPLTILYCIARAYIVIESFLCLRSLPVGAYDTISLDNVWPHL